jgi:hypothetical protein
MANLQPYPANPKMSKSEQDYQAEDDFRTLSRADEVKSDKGRMSGVKNHAKKTMASCSRVMGGKR